MSTCAPLALQVTAPMWSPHERLQSSMIPGYFALGNLLLRSIILYSVHKGEWILETIKCSVYLNNFKCHVPVGCLLG